MPETWIMNFVILFSGMFVGGAVVLLNFRKYFYFILFALIGFALPIVAAALLDSIIVFGL